MDGTSHFETAEFLKDTTFINDYSKLDDDYNKYDQGLRNLFRLGDVPIREVAVRIAKIVEIPEGK